MIKPIYLKLSARLVSFCALILAVSLAAAAQAGGLKGKVRTNSDKCHASPALDDAVGMFDVAISFIDAAECEVIQ